MDTVAILKNVIFFIVGTLLERGYQSNILSDINIHRIRSMNLIYQTWPQNDIWASLRFGVSICSTQMAGILDFVDKSWTNVAEMYWNR